MGKKVCMPSMDELYIMQDMGANVYKYLVIKAIESLIVEGINLPNKGILKTAYKYLRENPDIVYSICQMYPNELKYSEIARYEAFLCMKILDNVEDRTIYNLDNLVYFSDSVLDNRQVGNKVISLLSEKLPITPQYRFEYKQLFNQDKLVCENKLLDNIFSCNYKLDSYNLRDGILEKLIQIEPLYALKYQNLLDLSKNKYLLKTGINAYAERYSVEYDVGSKYANKDILTNPDVETKRLLKCINQNKYNLY